MTNSTKRRHLEKYEAALDKLDTIDESASDDIANYIYWLRDQLTIKRRVAQVQRAELDELRSGVKSTQDIHLRRSPDHAIAICKVQVVKENLRSTVIREHTTCTPCLEGK